MKVKIIRSGNSLAIRIPKTAVQKAHIKEGDFLEIEVSEGRIELHRITPVASLSKLIAQITPENRYGEISTVREVGKEAVE